MLLNNSSLCHITLSFLLLSLYPVFLLKLTSPYHSSHSHITLTFLSLILPNNVCHSHVTYTFSHFHIILHFLLLSQCPIISSHSHIPVSFLSLSHYHIVPLTITLPKHPSRSQYTKSFFHPHITVAHITLPLLSLSQCPTIPPLSHCSSSSPHSLHPIISLCHTVLTYCRHIASYNALFKRDIF
jgi:hypothetical protein